MTALVANLLRSGAQVVIRVRAVGITGFGPPILVPVAGIGSVGIRKSKIFLGLGVGGGLVRQFNFFPVLLLYFRIDVGHVNDLILQRGRRREEHEEIVPLLRLDLGSGPSFQVDQVDVVDNHVGIVLCAPLFGVGVI